MRLLIDAGHGGPDPGCTDNGLVEADLTLRLACRLAVLLASTSGELSVALTRRSGGPSGLLSLSERGKMSVCCDLVLCIHADTSPDPNTGFLSAYTLPGDDLAERVGSEVERAAPNILRPRTPGTTLARPIDWTHRACNVLRAHEPRSAVLVEVGFLSNPRHAAYLKSPQGQAAVVLALASGVVTGWDAFARKVAA